MRETPTWASPATNIARNRPDNALFYFAPAQLQATARRFVDGFAGLVTYAVKANAGDEVLANLVVNAQDAMSTGGRLTLATRNTTLQLPGDPHPTRWVQLTVADTGTGIAAEHLPHLFEPFYTTKPVGKGTGLGLSLSHGIIDRHGGAMSVDSQPGKGTTFTIELPLDADGGDG